jgi:hypothetical protein
VIAAFRAMIARWLRGCNDDLVKDLAGPAGDAVRLGEEQLDGAGGFVARPVSQPLELGGTGGKWETLEPKRRRHNDQPGFGTRRWRNGWSRCSIACPRISPGIKRSYGQ